MRGTLVALRVLVSPSGAVDALALGRFLLSRAGLFVARALVERRRIRPEREAWKKEIPPRHRRWAPSATVVAADSLSFVDCALPGWLMANILDEGVALHLSPKRPLMPVSRLAPSIAAIVAPTVPVSQPLSPPMSPPSHTTNTHALPLPLRSSRAATSTRHAALCAGSAAARHCSLQYLVSRHWLQ